jgi:two-component system response regulator MprA
MNQILVVEDEPAITHFLTRGLTDKGFAVTVVSCGEQALRAIEQGSPDLVLLDSGLPDLDGYEVCRRVRAQGYTNLPVVMLTAKGKVAETITGLESGADDCIAKPFTFEELLARIGAALRRQESRTRANRQLQVADLVLDTAARQVWRGGRALELTAHEYKLLEVLVRQAGQVLTKDILFAGIWGSDHEAGWQVVKVSICSLRRKLNTGGRPDLIQTVRSVGYMLKP